MVAALGQEPGEPGPLGQLRQCERTAGTKGRRRTRWATRLGAPTEGAPGGHQTQGGATASSITIVARRSGRGPHGARDLVPGDGGLRSQRLGPPTQQQGVKDRKSVV